MSLIAIPIQNPGTRDDIRRALGRTKIQIVNVSKRGLIVKALGNDSPEREIRRLREHCYECAVPVECIYHAEPVWRTWRRWRDR